MLQAAEVGDYVRKDGVSVRVEEIDTNTQTYHTSDGGCIGFDEVTLDDVSLESEVIFE